MKICYLRVLRLTHITLFYNYSSLNSRQSRVHRVLVALAYAISRTTNGKENLITILSADIRELKKFMMAGLKKEKDRSGER